MKQKEEASSNHIIKDNPFKKILKGKVVLFGIGNTMRGDDGVGPALIANLKSRVNAVCVDAGSAPENYLGKIIKENPDTVLIIDAVQLNSKPGTFEILEAGELARTGISTHDIPIPMIVDFISSQTVARIYILAIQPVVTDFGIELSKPVRKTIRQVENLIIEAIPISI
jgi:hydrogenase 3 maturation protease